MSKPDTEDVKEIVILVNGKRAETVSQAAARHGMERDSMTSAITRQKIPSLVRLDGRTPLFDPDVIDAALAARPGPDWRKGKGHKPKPKRTRKTPPAASETEDA